MRVSICPVAGLRSLFTGASVLLWLLVSGRIAVGSDNESENNTRVIDSIEIISRNVFDTDDPRYDNFLFHLANSLHIVTRPAIVRRELLLDRGEVFDTSLADESERNLRALPYLFESDISLRTGERGENILMVNTSDKWSTVARASLHRSGRRDDFQFGFEENNLLGYGILMSHDYFVLEDDRDYYQAEIADRRFLGKNLYLDLFYADNPRAGRTSITVGRPYYALSQMWSGRIGFERLNERVDYYLDETLAARDRLRLLSFQVANYYRFGQNDIKYYLMLLYSFTVNDWRGRKFENEDLFPPDVIQPGLPAAGVDSTIHYFQFGLRWQQIHFEKYYRLNRFHKPEDINHGLDVLVSAGYALADHQDNYCLYTLNPQYTYHFYKALLIGGFLGQQWQTSRKTLRRIINLYFRGYLQYNRHHTLATRVSFIYDRLPDPALRLYLDEERGLRGYPIYFDGGEKRLLINLEHRIYTDLELLSAGIGGVLFADIGNIWTRADRFSLDDSELSLGTGLRLGITRSTQAEILRVDVAYAPSLGEWQISVGTGQIF